MVVLILYKNWHIYQSYCILWIEKKIFSLFFTKNNAHFEEINFMLPDIDVMSIWFSVALKLIDNIDKQEEVVC